MNGASPRVLRSAELALGVGALGCCWQLARQYPDAAWAFGLLAALLLLGLWQVRWDWAALGGSERGSQGPGVAPAAGRVAVVAFALLLTFFFGTCTTFKGAVFLQAGVPDPYASLARGFARGQLSLDAPVDPGLLALPDPYDAQARGRVLVQAGGLPFHDLLLHQGRYYLMHGPLPVLAFYWPWRLLTGAYPSALQAVGFFNVLGFLAFFLLMARLKDRCFPEASELWVLGGGAALALGAPWNYFLSRPWIYEVCISSACAFLGLAALAYFWAVDSGPLRCGALTLASSLASAAALSRPHFLLAAAAMAGIFSCRLPAEGRQKWKLWTALWMPVIAAAALWMAYNSARFGRPLDFGLPYHLSGLRQSQEGFSQPWKGWRNLGAGVDAYLLTPYRTLGFFPYVGASAMVLDHGAMLQEENLGFFTLWPAAWLLLSLPFFLGGLERSRLKDFMQALGLGVALIMAELFSLPNSTYRYSGDFGPALFVLLWVEGLWLWRAARQAWAKAGVGTLFLLSGLSGAVLGGALNLVGTVGLFLKYSAWIGPALGLGTSP